MNGASLPPHANATIVCYTPMQCLVELLLLLLDLLDDEQASVEEAVDTVLEARRLRAAR